LNDGEVPVHIANRLTQILDRIGPGAEAKILLGMHTLLTDQEYVKQYSEQQFTNISDQLLPKTLILCQLFELRADPVLVGKKMLEHHMQLEQPDFEGELELECAWLYCSIENFVRDNKELFFEKA